jgi:hypothetical protein
VHLARHHTLALSAASPHEQPQQCGVPCAAAYHSTTMANTVGAPLLVFSKKGGMPALLSHYRPNKTVFAFTGWLLRGGWCSLYVLGCYTSCCNLLVCLGPALLSHYRPNKTVFAFTGQLLRGRWCSLYVLGCYTSCCNLLVCVGPALLSHYRPNNNRHSLRSVLR